ncbi:transglycosylase domain-containing protein [Anoxybacillus sp.]|uniref:transglycosylase domain-containing protein n=1 Tax=Anoxybacillus sp. TaxID=1872573 RepID=UPI002624494F|nr:penicillin-binding protein 1A [uncultured Anoxybacillus sp.]
MANYRSRTERKQAEQKKQRPRERGRSIMKKIVLIMLLIMTIGMFSGVAAFAWMIKDAPPLDETLLRDPLASIVYDANGQKVAELGQQKRIYVSYNDIPKVLEQAVLATEDARFYEHHGFDIVRFFGAVLANVREGFGAEGGSTITQQVVKLSFLTPEKTLKRKVQELWLAIRLEQKYSKHEILEMYLNKIYYSSRAYGVAKAAETYFGKSDLSQLTLPEAALLAGIPQSPNNYNPFTHPEAAEKRRNTVLSLMVKHGFISKEEAEEAKKVPVQSLLTENKQQSDIPYDSFIDQVIDEVTEKTGLDVFTAGLHIYTTLDPNAQSYVEQLLNSNEVIRTNKADFQAGIAVVDTKTGEIRALGGGRKEEGVTFGFNYATDTRKQPGSTIKPIIDYGPAIEYLKWSTYHQLKDEPYQYSDGTPIKNWDGKYEGQMSMRTALARSRNIPALKALQEVGLERAKEFANKLGMGFDEVHEAYAVGGVGKGVSPLQMAGAYSAFGNNGVYIEPHAVKKVVFPDGTEMDLRPEPKAAMKDYTAFMITDMLKTVVQSGTGTAANVPGLHIAGKTGTTNYDEKDRRKYGLARGAVPDSWFVGYTPNYTAAIWTGFSKKSSEAYLSKAEQQYAKQLFKRVISHIDDGSGGDFKQPKSVVKLAIKKGTNPPKLASEHTPKSEITYEYFVRGYEEPTEVAQDEPEVVEPVKDLRAQYDPTTKTISLSWSYTIDPEKDMSFEVRQTIDGRTPTVIATTKDSQLTVEAKEGSVYLLEVYVVTADGTRSAPATALVQIPKEEPQQPEENESPGQSGNGDTPETPTNPTNPTNPANPNEPNPSNPGTPTNPTNPNEPNPNNPSGTNNQQRNGNNDGATNRQ